jgi:hypothetical protein
MKMKIKPKDILPVGIANDRELNGDFVFTEIVGTR